MNHVLSVLKLIALCFVVALVLAFFVTPASAWESFGSAPEGSRLLIEHLLRMLSGIANLTVLLTLVLGGLGCWIDYAQAKSAAAKDVVANSASGSAQSSN